MPVNDIKKLKISTFLIPSNYKRAAENITAIISEAALATLFKKMFPCIYFI